MLATGYGEKTDNILDIGHRGVMASTSTETGMRIMAVNLSCAVKTQ